MAPKVAVVGAGIIGMTTAVRAIESIPNLDITVVAADFTPRTTGDIAAGLFNPYLVGGVSKDTLRTWCLDTFDLYSTHLKTETAPELGLTLLSAYILDENPIERPGYADSFFCYRDLEKKELEMFPKKFRYGAFINSIAIECKSFIPYLMRRFRSKGGKFLQKKLNSLDDLSGDFDIVINCSGVGAASLTPDTEVYPVRGQTIRVKAPWIKHCVVAGTEFHIIPNIHNVMLGGTKQKGDWNLNPTPEDKEKIWNGCLEFMPSLKDAQFIGDYVGLRPGRDSVRIEIEERTRADKNSQYQIVHNYGHGGSGITICWGCAKDAVGLLKQSMEIQQRHPGRFSSKL